MTSGDFVTKVTPVAWRVLVGFAGVAFSVGFTMTILGWRFTGDSDDIRSLAAQTATIAPLEQRVTALEQQNGALMYMTCAMYKKLYPDAPAPKECP